MPPDISSSFPKTSANASRTLSVSCSASGATPLTWVWLQNGVELSPSGRVSYQEAGPSSTLTVSSLVEEDEGVYQCVVHQPATARVAAHHQFIDVVGKSAFMITQGWAHCNMVWEIQFVYIFVQYYRHYENKLT